MACSVGVVTAARLHIHQSSMATQQERRRCTKAFLSQCLGRTCVSYEPRGPTDGSWARRYDVYKVARTLEETLVLGSRPSDWCRDYERGLLKISGPMRDEPLDLHVVALATEATAVDRAISRWMLSGVARPGRTPKILHCLRLQANALASEILGRGAGVSGPDVLSVLRAWCFKRNAGRRNVIPDGQAWVHSDTLGLIPCWRGDSKLTMATRLYPDVYKVLCAYLQSMLGRVGVAFDFTSINVNFGYAAKIHRDSNNIGPSMIKALGDFDGGRLRIWDDDGSKCLEELRKTSGFTAYDLSAGPEGGLLLFDGRCAHEVEEFSGERYTLVYFTSARAHMCSQEDAATLEALRGARLPALAGLAPPTPASPPLPIFWPNDVINS